MDDDTKLSVVLYKAAHARAVEAWDLPADERPPVEVIAQVPESTSTYLESKPVRAAKRAGVRRGAS